MKEIFVWLKAGDIIQTKCDPDQHYHYKSYSVKIKIPKTMTPDKIVIKCATNVPLG